MLHNKAKHICSRIYTRYFVTFCYSIRERFLMLFHIVSVNQPAQRSTSNTYSTCIYTRQYTQGKGICYFLVQCPVIAPAYTQGQTYTPANTIPTCIYTSAHVYTQGLKKDTKWCGPHFCNFFIKCPVLHKKYAQLGLGSLRILPKLPQKETIFENPLLTPI